MLLLSRVCAEFRDRSGRTVFRVTPATRLTFQEAPEAIREDPLFQLLLNDGSLEAADTVSSRKQLEAEPLKDTDADGRKRAPARRPAAKSDSSPAAES